MDCTALRGCHPGRRPTRASVGRMPYRSRACYRSRSASRAFTLVEFLVVISIVTILTSLLMPSLARSRDAADRLRCASNLRQVGGALVAFIDDNNDRLPVLTAVLSQNPRYSEGMALTTLDGGEVDGLGRLLACSGRNYLGDPRLLYCPCHRGEHSFQRYASQIGGAILDTEPGTAAYCNYQYRSPIDPTTGGQIFDAMRSNKVLVADGMRTRSDFNHVKGTNRLFGDCHVDWRADLDGAIYRNLPTSNSLLDLPNAYKLLWGAVDSDGMKR